MKKACIVLLVTSIISMPSIVLGFTIVGSLHDLSQKSGFLDQICIYCHVAHNANNLAPLWNRNDVNPSVFTLYSGLNMANVSFKNGFTSDSISLLCMSCHDGLTSINMTHNGTLGSDSVITGAAALGRDLSTTHPINFPVSQIDKQRDLHVSSNPYMGPGQPSGKIFPLFRTNAPSPRGSDGAPRMLECPSCHSVHNAEYSPFLRDTLTRSQLCLGCHNK